MSYISEKEIIKSVSPIPINEEDLEEVSVLGEHGLWANKQEVENWNGSFRQFISQLIINKAFG